MKMKIYAVWNSILTMLKTGSSVFPKAANFAILKLLLADNVGYRKSWAWVYQACTDDGKAFI